MAQYRNMRLGFMRRGERAAAMTPGELARASIALSVPVAVKLRHAAGKGGDVLTLRNQVRQLFAEDAERVEAVRLLDLVAWNRRDKHAQSNGQSAEGGEDAPGNL